MVKFVMYLLLLMGLCVCFLFIFVVVMGCVIIKVDVFSFGVVLMEMMIGRRVLDEMEVEENMYFVMWF